MRIEMLNSLCKYCYRCLYR